MLRTCFIIIIAFKNVLFNRNTVLLETSQKHQLATAEETSQEGCTPSVKLLISAEKRDFLPNHILRLEEDKILSHTVPEIFFLFPLITSSTRQYNMTCSQAALTLELFGRCPSKT